ncbi:hypothetical protein [Photobacterium lipolyticum]|uniref:Uncharacterized protein n=1 Tax=Photobacterium lipolyticum TaxID=266810 RepID=A0A2T3N1U2_9GAMM|nr:hypothetical protein [Photobacterium lipolyticum]PSW06241.1 hypothetical protein C9I89_06965 [Photobacterium lipolyticum]
MLQEKFPDLTQNLLNALMVIWDKNENQVIDTLDVLEEEYKVKLDKNLLYLEQTRKVEKDKLISAWDRTRRHMHTSCIIQLKHRPDGV